MAQGRRPRDLDALDANVNGALATACRGSSESSVPPDLVRLFRALLHRPELPEARCPARAGGQLLQVAMFQ